MINSPPYSIAPASASPDRAHSADIGFSPNCDNSLASLIGEVDRAAQAPFFQILLPLSGIDIDRLEEELYSRKLRYLSYHFPLPTHFQSDTGIATRYQSIVTKSS